MKFEGDFFRNVRAHKKIHKRGARPSIALHEAAQMTSCPSSNVAFSATSPCPHRRQLLSPSVMAIFFSFTSIDLSKALAASLLVVVCSVWIGMSLSVPCKMALV